MGTIIDLKRMGGDVRVAIDGSYSSQTNVWRRREAIARVATDPNTVQGIQTPAAEALRLLLRNSLGEEGEPGRVVAGGRRAAQWQDSTAASSGAATAGVSMWATSPLNLNSTMTAASAYASEAAVAARRQSSVRRKHRGETNRVREHVAHGSSPAAAERQVREEEAASLKLYRTSRLYGIIGDIDADEGCSPRTWWFNERERRAAAQRKAIADREVKEAQALAAAEATTAYDDPSAFQSPYAERVSASSRSDFGASRANLGSSGGGQRRLRGGGRLLVPPSRAKSPPVAEPRLSHLTPSGPLLWDPVRGFSDKTPRYNRV